VLTSAFGLAVLGVFVVFAMLPEMRAAGECLPSGAVVQFELARNGADIAAIFGAAGDPCRALAVAAMDAVNMLDVRLFIPVYTLFCVSAAMLLAGGSLRPFAVLALLAAGVALAGDYVETTALLDITHYLDDPSQRDSFMSQALLGAWVKFGALAVHALACAGLCFGAAPQRRVLGALLLLPTLGVAAAAYDYHAYASAMNAAFSVAWGALLVAALIAAARKEGAAREQL
jgi:hypothetical protein